MDRRPRIIVPARFSTSASALRFAAEVTARRLVTAVFDAGGEPLTVHPSGADDDPDKRFGFADGVVLPGGGDVDPARYGAAPDPSVYDVDSAQDDFDLSVARWAWSTGRPLLAICRGLQIVNVSRGGTLVTHMPVPHRHVVSPLTLDEGSRLRTAVGADTATISCFHHQALRELGSGLHVTARGSDSTIEAVERARGDDGWFLGLQWHPEDTYDADPAQARIFREFVEAARRFDGSDSL